MGCRRDKRGRQPVAFEPKLRAGLLHDVNKVSTGVRCNSFLRLPIVSHRTPRRYPPSQPPGRLRWASLASVPSLPNPHPPCHSPHPIRQIRRLLCSLFFLVPEDLPSCTAGSFLIRCGIRGNLSDAPSHIMWDGFSLGFLTGREPAFRGSVSRRKRAA